MSINETIRTDMKTALKKGNKQRLAALRMIRARLQEAELTLRTKHGADYQIEDGEALKALTRHAKQLREAIEAYRSGGREERAVAEQAELDVVKTYLPRRLEENEVREIVREAIIASGATSPRQMGTVMKLVMPRVQGSADGKLVQSLVREELADAADPNTTAS